MGTPRFAVPTLEMLINNTKTDVIGVFTQPDKPKGRGHRMAMPPVKEVALAKGIPVFQPAAKISTEEMDILEKLNPDLIVVVAYGQILPDSVIRLPVYGCINVHASLLPHYRGAAPIQWAIISGEKSTGVTTMQMDKGLDTGDMLMKESIPIKETDTYVTMHDKLSILGAKVLRQTLEAIEEGTLLAEPQEHSKSTYAPMLHKDTGEINWNQSATSIHCLIRGTQPWPAAYTFYKGEKMKVWKSKVIKGPFTSLNPGVLRQVSPEGLLVDTAEDQLLIEEIQFSGKKRMSIASYLAGNAIETKVVLGAEHNDE